MTWIILISSLISSMKMLKLSSSESVLSDELFVGEGVGVAVVSKGVGVFDGVLGSADLAFELPPTIGSLDDLESFAVRWVMRSTGESVFREVTPFRRDIAPNYRIPVSARSPS